MAASARGAGEQAIQPATDLVVAGLIASGIALPLAQISWFCSRPGDKLNSSVVGRATSSTTRWPPRTADTRVIISAFRIEKTSEDHPCILRYTPEGLG